MNLKISVARGLVKIEDLMPGTLFMYQDKIAVKCSSSSSLAWDCIVIGTGNELYDYSMLYEEFNELLVTPIRIDDADESEIEDRITQTEEAFKMAREQVERANLLDGKLDEIEKKFNYLKWNVERGSKDDGIASWYCQTILENLEKGELE